LIKNKPELLPLISHSDIRGTFTRTFDLLAPPDSKFSVVQVNISVNPQPFTLRGMHFQTSGPNEEKIISLLSGSAFLVAVDLREESPSFLEQSHFELTYPLAESIHVPSRFATGWLSTSPNTVFQYLMSARFEDCKYSGLRFDDPILSIDWPAQPSVVSEKDLAWPPLERVLRQP
jgi:dTDP-4-dehydrorhamnose 3,5-epimerase